MLLAAFRRNALDRYVQLPPDDLVRLSRGASPVTSRRPSQQIACASALRLRELQLGGRKLCDELARVRENAALVRRRLVRVPDVPPQPGIPEVASLPLRRPHPLALRLLWLI